MRGKTGVRKKIAAWIMTFAMMTGVVMVPVGKVYALSVGETSTNVTATLIESNVDGSYHEYFLKIDNKSSTDIKDWLVEIPVSGITSAQDWSEWSKVKVSYTDSYLYLTPTASSDKTINAGGVFGSTTEGSYKFNYMASSNVSSPVVYYSTTAGAFDEIIANATTASGSSGGGNGGGGDSVSGTGSLAADTTTSLYPDDEYNFAKLLQYSLYFYDANMCGDVEGISEVEWRKNCHSADKSVSYKGHTVDVSGGFHDAGDHDKFALTEGYSASMLGMGYYEFKEAYEETGQKSHYKKILDYFCDSFVRRTVLDNEGNAIAFCYQVGDGRDHDQWISADKETTERPVYFADAENPATDQISEVVAALAIHYVNFGNDDYLDCAKKLFDLAKKSSKSKKPNGTFYPSSGYEDDYCLAAVWLYKATNDESYIAEYKKYCNNMSQSCPQAWDQVGAFSAGYYNYFYEKSTTVAPLAANATIQINKKTNTSDGYLVLDKWGSARHNCNVQLGGLISDKESGKNQYGAWATGQMKYLLGNNKKHQCFVTWYNDTNASQHPHHRSACDFDNDWDKFNANATQNHKLLGALVGGPSNTNGDYVDTVTDAVANEVAIDYNAAFTGAAAALYLLNKDDGGQMLDSDYVIDDTATCEQNAGGDPTKPAENVDGISLSKAKMDLKKNKSETLVATTTLDGTVVTWTSDNKSVATVDENGKVTAVGKGTANITAATPSGKKSTCIVTVTVPLEKLVLKKNNEVINDIGIKKGEKLVIADSSTADIVVIPVPEDADYDAITLNSGEPDIVSVNNTTHEVTAVAKGNAIVTVSSGDIKTLFAIDVTVVPTGITLNKTSLSLTTTGENASYELNATVIPKDATDNTIVWSIEPEDIVDIDENGASVTITAKKNGKAVLTAAIKGYPDHKATCDIAVSAPVGSVNLEKEELTLVTTDEAVQLVPTIDVDGGSYEYAWGSSDNGIVTVDDEGYVKAVGDGTALVTVSVGGKEAQCSVISILPIENVKIKKGDVELTAEQGELPVVELSVEDEMKLGANVYPKGATGRDEIKWEITGAKDILSIDEKGNITALKTGETSIKVTVGKDIEITGDSARTVNNKVTALAKVVVSEKAAEIPQNPVKDPYEIDLSKIYGGADYAENATYINSLYVKDEDGTKTFVAAYEDGVLNLLSGKNYKLTGSNDTLSIVYSQAESVATDDTNSVTLENASLKDVNADVAVNIKGTTAVKGDIKADSIAVADNGAVTITGDVTTDTFNVDAKEGTVIVNGNINAGNVEIISGTITVDESIAAVNNVEVSGGNVTVSKGIKADASVSVISGNVAVTGTDNNSAITANNVELSGGNVTATGGIGTAAIDAKEKVTVGRDVNLSVNCNKKSDGSVESAIKGDSIIVENGATITANENARTNLFSSLPKNADGVDIDVTKYTGENKQEDNNGGASSDSDTSGIDSNTNNNNDGKNQAVNAQQDHVPQDINNPVNEVVRASDMALFANVKSVNGITVSGTYQLAVKKSMTLLAAFSPEGAVAENIIITSSSPNIVSVSGTKLTAKKAGTAKITVVSDNGLTKTFSVKVMKKAVSKIKIKASKKSVKVGKTIKLKVTTFPSKKKASNKIYWKSSNESVAIVTQKGVVKGIKKGKVKISAITTDGSGKKATVKITVK